jgi:hypothetical protein
MPLATQPVPSRESLPDLLIVIGTPPSVRDGGWQWFMDHLSTMIIPAMWTDEFTHAIRRPKPGLDWTPQATRAHLCHALSLDLAIASGADIAMVIDGRTRLGPQVIPQMNAFFSKVPSDWGIVLFGGFHLFPPSPVCPLVLRVEHCINDYAYAIRRSAMATLKSILSERECEFPHALLGCQGLCPTYTATKLDVLPP